MMSHPHPRGGGVRRQWSGISKSRRVLLKMSSNDWGAARPRSKGCSHRTAADDRSENSAQSLACSWWAHPTPVGGATPPHASEQLQSCWVFVEVYGKIKDKLEDCQMVNACAAAGEELSLETVTAVAQRVVVWGGFAATGCASSELWCGRLAFCRAVEVDLEVCMCVGVCAGWMGKETRVLLNVNGGRC